MDKFINFCAGADISSLPGSPINALLINAFSNFKTDGEKERVEQLIDTAQPEWLILDSGGYQLKDAEEEIEKGNEITILMDKNKPMQPHKGIINLTPEHVVEAAVHVKPQIMIALDFPVKDLKDSPEEREREFRAKLGFNALWAIESSKLVEAAQSRGDLNDVKLLLPIQCYTLEQFNRYWHFIHSEGDIQFDGFSMPLRNLSLREAALFLIAFHKKSKKRMVHFLGEGNFSSIAFAAYLSKLD